MKKIILFLLVLFYSLIAISQHQNTTQPSLPNFEKYDNGNYKNSLLFLPHLVENYSEFISFSQFSVWSHRKVALSLAISHDSTFMVTQTSFPLDTPNVYITRQLIPNNDFKKIIQSLKKVEAFTLKDEKEVPECVKYLEDTLNGQKIVGISKTTFISDGLTSLITIYAKGKFRFSSYYELDEAKKLCPTQPEWEKAIKVRDAINLLFTQYQRAGPWERKGMRWLP